MPLSIDAPKFTQKSRPWMRPHGNDKWEISDAK